MKTYEILETEYNLNDEIWCSRLPINQYEAWRPAKGMAGVQWCVEMKYGMPFILVRVWSNSKFAKWDSCDLMWKVIHDGIENEVMVEGCADSPIVEYINVPENLRPLLPRRKKDWWWSYIFPDNKELYAYFTDRVEYLDVEAGAPILVNHSTFVELPKKMKEQTMVFVGNPPFVS